MQREGLGQVWNWVWPILLLVAIAALLAAATFLVWGPLSTMNVRSYSDRVFWAGIGLIVLGGIAAISTIGSMSTVGTPSIMTAGADARNAQSRIQDHFKTNARRYRNMSTFLVSGLFCIAISALLEIATR
jgi:hypothetical protein